MNKLDFDFSIKEPKINNKISFQNLQKEDLKLLLKWLNNDFVKQWYYKNGKNNENYIYEDIEKKYLPRVLKQDPTNSFLIIFENEKIGYIQWYLLKDYPEYNKYVDGGNDSAGIDLFIGEEAFIHKGLGSKIIKKFIKENIFCNNWINRCIIGPEPKNIVAIKAYNKAGFKYIKTVQIPNEEEPEYIMELKKIFNR